MSITADTWHEYTVVLWHVDPGVYMVR